MRKFIQQLCYAAALTTCIAGGSQVSMPPVLAATDSFPRSATKEANHQARPESPSDLALKYAEALAAGRVEEWAALDLGCIARKKNPNDADRPPKATSESQACWDATMVAHRSLVADETEPGIFGALGRGTGFGLIHSSHQHADFWKDYPPAVAVSPSVIRETPGVPVPLVQVASVLEPQAAGLFMAEGQVPGKIQKVGVDLSVTYPDPLTAPLALLPDEPWWASPVIRKYAPVRSLLVRFKVVRGLKALGYPVDQAVVNEALPGSPQVAEPSAPGILPSSPRWWDRGQDQQRFEGWIREAHQAPSFQEKIRKYQRLLLLDPEEPRVNALYGMDLYLAFLQEGMAKGKITSTDESISQSLGELYWNIQAQTWRQEFTEVAVGHSFAADVFYQAMPAMEIAIKGGQGNEEIRRKLGSMLRWNNDTDSALSIHEQLLKNIRSGDTVRRSHLLSELAWDRVQWLSWNRRYDHPWINQAREEAEEALRLAVRPVDKMSASEALVILDSLAVPRDQRRLLQHVEVVRTWHDQLAGVTGMWNHLVGNELVKSLVPEGVHVSLPAPERSPEVMHRDVHSTIQDLNFFKTWTFDKNDIGGIPSGFSTGSSHSGVMGEWRIEADSQAPSLPNVITQASPCSGEGCFQVLLKDGRTHALPDLAVFLRQMSSGDQGEAGIVLAAKDPRNFYAVTMNPDRRELSIFRVQDGTPTLLGKGSVKVKQGPWHFLRVQMVNSAHVDHPLLEIYVDGFETGVMASEPIQGAGFVGIATKGDMVAQFDRLGVIEMITSRPMSKPAAY